MRPIHASVTCRALAIALSALVLLGCSNEYPGGGDPPANLLLVTLDTTRADRLGCYGDATAATPNLDRVAAEGALMTRAIAVAPITLPSHASILTGLYPPRHGVRDNSDFRLPDEARTLTEHLAERGYATAAIVGAYVLSSDFGLAQGFDVYDEPGRTGAMAPRGKELRHRPMLDRPAAEVTDRALALVGDELEEPFFLWVHYFDPHAEYTPPQPFAERFRDRPYAGEIAYTDQQLGRLIESLRDRELLDRTLVAVTADHGESLGQHGENTHGLFVYDATIHVPLMLRFPGVVPRGVRKDRLVSGVDLAPTLLDLLGLPPLSGIDGESFASTLRGQTAAPRAAVYAEAQLPARAYGWAPLYALRDGEEKFVAAPEPELYDLREDPAELRNLAPTSPAKAEAWADRLAHLRRGWPAASGNAVQPLDPIARARLQSLGYLGSGPAIEPTEGGADPKRFVGLHNRLLEAQVAVASGDLDRARDLLRGVLEVDPRNPAALGLSGTLLCTADRCDEGLALLSEAAQRSPDVYEIQRNLANALHLAGRLEEAAATFGNAIALHPFSGEDHYGLGNVLVALGRIDEALAAYDEALRLGPASAYLLAARGVALMTAGDVAEAQASLRRAVGLAPELTDAWNSLGVLAEKSGDLVGARELYASALRADPGHAGALFARAKVALRLGEVDPARRDVLELLELHPDDPAGRYLHAQVELAGGDRASARRLLREFLARPGADPRLIRPARELLDRLENQSP